MIKVLQILYSGLGGHGSVAFSLLDADKKSEWEPVMGFLGIEPLSSAYAAICSERGILYKYFPATRGRPWETWPKIGQWLTKSRPDAIILHSPSAIFPCFLYAYCFHVKLVLVEHEPNSLKRTFGWVFSCIGMLLSDSVIVLTPEYKKELKERLGLFYRENKIQIIPNGINTGRFIPKRSHDKNSNKVRLGMAARFTLSKRQDVLIEMLKQLRTFMPEITWQLTLAGNGENWENIRHLVEADALGYCIGMPGQLDEAELVCWYQSLDIYLHASDGETLSTSLLQAMASGLAIVASDIPGISNLIGGDKSCGLLVKEQAAKGFADAVVSLVKNETLKTFLSERARKLVTTSFSQDKMFACYNNLLRNYD